MVPQSTQAKIDVKRAADRKEIIPFCPAQFNQRCWSERAGMGEGGEGVTEGEEAKSRCPHKY